MNKKDFPLFIHQELNQLRNTYKKYFRSASPTKPLMVFEDTDESSGFIFSIDSFYKDSHYYYYDVTYYPQSENELAGLVTSLKFVDVEKRIKNWASVIEKYDKTQHFFYDPIIEAYTKEYFDEYKILEEDADTNPFDIKRQLLIDQYLESSVKFLDKYQKKNQEIDLTEPIELANDLRANITTFTKNEVIQKLSQFWAVARKKGLPIIKEIFFELAKELIKEWGKKMLGM